MIKDWARGSSKNVHKLQEEGLSSNRQMLFKILRSTYLGCYFGWIVLLEICLSWFFH